PPSIVRMFLLKRSPPKSTLFPYTTLFRSEKATVQEKTLAEGFSNLQVKAAVTAFVEGWHLGTYAFLPYKSKEKPFSTTLEIIGGGCQKYVETGRIRAEATAFTRDLMNERHSALNPETFPERLLEALSDTSVQVPATEN